MFGVKGQGKSITATLYKFYILTLCLIKVRDNFRSDRLGKINFMDMDVDGVTSERVAILDAGAQYSKLIDR